MIKKINRFYFPILMMSFLSSCQHQMNERHQNKVHQEHMKKAAQLNAQLGLAYLSKGNVSRAKKKLLYALKLDKNSPEINGSMAYFFEKTGDMDNASQYYQNALRIAPANGAQLNNYGAFLCRRGNYDKAEMYFLKAIQDVNYVNSAGAYENAGLCQMSAKNYKQALAHFEQALTQDPERYESLLEAVKIELRFKKYSKALALLNQFPELAMKNSQLLQLGIKAAAHTGQHEMESKYQKSLATINLLQNTPGVTDEYNNLSG